MRNSRRKADNVSPPTFPDSWINGYFAFFGISVLIYFFYNNSRRTGQPDWVFLSDMWIGDMSILMTVTLFITFIARRLYLGVTDKEIQETHDDAISTGRKQQRQGTREYIKSKNPPPTADQILTQLDKEDKEEKDDDS